MAAPGREERPALGDGHDSDAGKARPAMLPPIRSALGMHMVAGRADHRLQRGMRRER
jgi:hypothetical protein